MQRRPHFLKSMALLAAPLAFGLACGAELDDMGMALEADDDADDDTIAAGADALTTHHGVGIISGFALDIAVAGDDVVLDWSATGNTAGASVLRSTDPAILIAATTGAPPAGADVFTIPAGTTSYTDVGAASRTNETPRYFYRVDSNAALSTLVMKTTTAMAPGYNKFGMCMLDGPSRASDVAARLGSSVVGVWGWDAANQTYITWTPAQGVGGDDDFTVPFGGVFAAQVDGSTPAYQSLVGVVPTSEALVVSGEPGYNWSTFPALYSGSTSASYWVDQVGYWGMGQWSNLTQGSSWYWGAGYTDFDVTACQPFYTYLPNAACTSNDDCAADKYCNFVDDAACGDVAAGLCTPHPMGCEFAPAGEVCGCDDVTYANDCEAAAAGVSVASEGACEPPPCDAEPCVNGSCTNEDDGYSCECDAGWIGTNCDEVPGICDSNPCANGGECIESGDGASFTCICASGFTGPDCTTPYDACGGELDDLGSTVPQSVLAIDLAGNNDDLDSACSNAGGPDRAYTFTAPSAGGYRFDTQGSAGDPVLSVLNDCGGPELSCNDDTVFLQSQIDIVMEAGETVTIMLDSFNVPPPGTLYQLNVSEVVIDESVCGCFADTLFANAILGPIISAPTACSADGNSITGISAYEIPDRLFLPEAFGRTFCQSDLITAFVGPRRVLLSDTQAQSCRDLFAQTASGAGLVCE